MISGRGAWIGQVRFRRRRAKPHQPPGPVSSKALWGAKRGCDGSESFALTAWKASGPEAKNLEAALDAACHRVRRPVQAMRQPQPYRPVEHTPLTDGPAFVERMQTALTGLAI